MRPNTTKEKCLDWELILSMNWIRQSKESSVFLKHGGDFQKITDIAIYDAFLTP